MRATGSDVPLEVLEAAQKLQPLDLRAMQAKPMLSELDVLALQTNDSTLTLQVPACTRGWRSGVACPPLPRGLVDEMHDCCRMAGSAVRA